MYEQLIGQRLALVFLLGVVLLNDPVLSLFDGGHMTLGVPLIYLYLFGAWALVIALVALVVHRGGVKSD